jgi:hypothetical protein
MKLSNKQIALMQEVENHVFLPFCQRTIVDVDAIRILRKKILAYVEAHGGRYRNQRRRWALGLRAQFEFHILGRNRQSEDEILTTLKSVLKYEAERIDVCVNFTMMAAQTIKKTNPTAARKLVAQARKRLPNQWASWCWGEYGIGLSVMNLAAELGVTVLPPPVPTVAQSRREKQLLRQLETAIAEK